MRPVALALILGFVAPPALAHDFWLQPQAFRFAEATPLTLQVGHGAARQRSPIRKDRIVRFEAIGPDGRSLDLADDLHPGQADEDARLALPASGQYVIVLQTDDRAESHLTAERFNLHVETEGLTPAVEARRAREATEGSERYSRAAKTIVQVGPGGGASAVLTPVGLPLEITPEADPYAVGRPDALPVGVRWQGRPLAGALVKLTDLAHDAEPVEVHRTDAAGRTVFQIPPHGAWLLTAVWTRPLPTDAEVDFETVFASLSLGDR